MGFDKISYNNGFNRENYDVVKALVPKGKKAVIKAAADEKGISVSQLIVDALETVYQLDLSKPNT